MLRIAGCVIVLSPLFTSCAHVGLLPTQTERSVASETFQYAQMSLNAYDKNRDKFALTPDLALVKMSPNDDIGLAYAIFTRERPNQPPEHIIAFRGTEGPAIFGPAISGSATGPSGSSTRPSGSFAITSPRTGSALPGTIWF